MKWCDRSRAELSGANVEGYEKRVIRIASEYLEAYATGSECHGSSADGGEAVTGYDVTEEAAASAYSSERSTSGVTEDAAANVDGNGATTVSDIPVSGIYIERGRHRERERERELAMKVILSIICMKYQVFE